MNDLVLSALSTGLAVKYMIESEKAFTNRDVKAGKGKFIGGLVGSAIGIPGTIAGQAIGYHASGAGRKDKKLDKEVTGLDKKRGARFFSHVNRLVTPKMYAKTLGAGLAGASLGAGIGAAAMKGKQALESIDAEQLGEKAKSFVKKMAATKSDTSALIPDPPAHLQKQWDATNVKDAAKVGAIAGGLSSAAIPGAIKSHAIAKKMGYGKTGRIANTLLGPYASLWHPGKKIKK